VLVQKKNGFWKLNIDYRALNNIAIKNRYLIPQIDDTLDQINGANFFSNINLNSSYHKVIIKQTNAWKTIFKSKEGLFEWLVMPFHSTNF